MYYSAARSPGVGFSYRSLKHSILRNSYFFLNAGRWNKIDGAPTISAARPRPSGSVKRSAWPARAVSIFMAFRHHVREGRDLARADIFLTSRFRYAGVIACSAACSHVNAHSRPLKLFGEWHSSCFSRLLCMRQTDSPVPSCHLGRNSGTPRDRLEETRWSCCSSRAPLTTTRISTRSSRRAACDASARARA